jgi:iron complex outermembrane receptor protein
MPKKKSILFFFVFLSVVVHAQHTISGKIIASSLLPIGGSHIHAGKKTVSSDENGFYVLKNLPSGKLALHISYIGYKPIDTLVFVSRDLVLNFTLTQRSHQLEDIYIKKGGNSLNKSIREQKIQGETLEKYSNQTLGDALKEIAGVSSLKTGNAIVKPIINGLYGSRVPLISNNVRLEDQQWGAEHAPNLDVNSAGKITVIKGASGLQYGGDAVGGLIVVEPLMVRGDSLFGKTIFTAESNGKGGSAATRFQRSRSMGWNYSFQGTFRYVGDKSAPDYVLSNTGNRENNFSGDIRYSQKKYDFTASYSYFNAVIGILSASHVGNANELYQSINNQIPAVIQPFGYAIKSPRQELQHHLAKVSYQHRWDETESLQFQYAFQLNKRLEFDIRRANYATSAALDLDLTTHSGAIDYKKINHDWTLKSGLNGSYQTNFANPSTGVRPLIPNFTKIDLGVYGIVSHNFTTDFSVESGLRYDYSDIQASKYYLKSRWSERGYDALFSSFIVSDYNGTQWLTKPTFCFHNLAASLGFHKEFGGNADGYFNISLSNRNPNPSEFFSDGLHHASGVIELGDLALKKEQSLKIGTTFQQKWNRFSVELNPYLSAIQNYMFLRPIGFETTIRGTFPVWEYQQTRAQLTGIDVQTNLKIGTNWNESISFSYVNGRDLTQNSALIDLPPMQLNHKIQYCKKEWYKLLLEVKNEVVFYQPQFPNNNFTTNILVNNEFVPVVVDISTPPPGYHLLHFYSEIKFTSFSKINTTLAFTVQNMLNTNYRDYLNRQRFYANEIGRNIQIQLKFNY